MDEVIGSTTSKYYPAPANRIPNDPTPANQAVYIPSVTPSYAIKAHARNWARELPQGVGEGDLDFLDPNNPLFRISHVMSSAGQALMQTRPCIINQRDRALTTMIADSGGYQIAGGSLVISGDADRLRILRWLEQQADWAMTLDVPTGRAGTPGYRYATANDCLKETLGHLDFFQKHRKPGAVGFLNVLQGNTTQQTDTWFNAVKGYEFEGWAFAGKLRKNFFNLCRRIIMMADQNLIQDRNWIHVLGASDLHTAVGLTALQRAINDHINKDLRISFDTSTPFRMSRWSDVFSIPVFSEDGMSLSSAKCPDARKYVRSSIRFPWPSALGDRMTLGDICVVDGTNLNTYRDSQSQFYQMHHNLSSLCSAIVLANRVFDSESLEKHHTIASKMGKVVGAIKTVIASGRLDVLEQHRSTFHDSRAVENPGEEDFDRLEVPVI